MEAGPSPFPITEQSMAMRLGVDRNWLREHRGEAGDLWTYGPNRQVCYAEKATDALAAILDPEKAGRGGHPADAEKPLPGAAGDGPAVLVVLRCRWVNRRVVTAKTSEGKTVTVWVVDSRRFAPGMAILGSPRPGRPGVFDFAGNPENPADGPRMPRRPGIW
jgi:hypothetical protein